MSFEIESIAALFIGVAIGSIAVWVFRERPLRKATEDLANERLARIRAEAILGERETGLSDKLAALTTLRGDIEKELKALAMEALQANQASFLALASDKFNEQRELAAAEHRARHETMDGMLKPMNSLLDQYQKSLVEIENARREAYGGIARELANVVRTQADARAETSKLVNALRASPKIRGRWGEHQLRNVLELAGMTAHVDYVTEESYVRDEAVLRPDAVIRLPGDRSVVVDAKTSMAAYLDAVDCVDETEREAHLGRHAQQIRQHMRLLAAKAYWDRLTTTPDFVAMFIPGDNFFAAAMERDARLFEDAVAAKVLIVTPTTLIALAKAVAFGWRQEKVAENARNVADLGRELYKRMSVMGGHLVQLQMGLDRTVKNFNQLVGSVEGSVMPQARKFTELDVEGTQQPLQHAAAIDREVRLVRTDADLRIAENAE